VWVGLVGRLVWLDGKRFGSNRTVCTKYDGRIAALPLVSFIFAKGVKVDCWKGRWFQIPRPFECGGTSKADPDV
jgi:hypothetical protein